MGRILKALILAFIGKKIYDRMQTDEPEKKPAHAKATAPKGARRKPTTARAA